MWNVGPSAAPPMLPDRLRSAGLRDPDPPFDPVAAAMILTSEPPPAPGIEVRRIETFEEHLAGLEIILSGNWTQEAADDERRFARRTYERRERRGASEWLALVDGTPVAHALAEPSPIGLFLAGGATLPEARGQGCYRALVRARWDEAMRLGLPGLAVQAQYGSSAPILRRLGFRETGVVHTLQSPRA
jgi:GNAT superfamily N-acetyltransferase